MKHKKVKLLFHAFCVLFTLAFLAMALLSYGLESGDEPDPGLYNPLPVLAVVLLGTQIIGIYRSFFTQKEDISGLQLSAAISVGMVIFLAFLFVF